MTKFTQYAIEKKSFSSAGIHAQLQLGGLGLKVLATPEGIDWLRETFPPRIILGHSILQNRKLASMPRGGVK